MSRNKVSSFVLAVVFCLFLILAGWPPVTRMLEQFAQPGLVEAVAAFSFMTHFEGFQRGVLDSRNIVFFLTVMGFALFATSVILRGHRS
jgi:ABC-2 type transport system permease protein